MITSPKFPLKFRQKRVSFLFALCGLSLPLVAGAQQQKDVKLVLQITVDQLRGDTMTRFGDRFVKGGFRHLLENGVHFSNTHYDHANTETAPGHATLATGANPSRHGIVANDWINATTGAFVYNTEDDRHHILGSEKKPHQGVSPRNLLSTTIGDELVLHSGSRSRAFAVSPKDRGAILPGGHFGKAFWYSKRSGTFVTSSYYYDDYPEWAAQWNESKPTARYQNQSWSLLNPIESYIARDIDDRPYEGDIMGLGRTFPHPLGDGSSKYFNAAIGLTPMADELALEFAKVMFEAEAIAAGDSTDYLQISFSSCDYAGHFFGASSLEYEDAVLRVDALLADLFAFIDEKVGLDKTVIALCADHGGPESPEYMQSLGFDAGRFPLDLFKINNPFAMALQKRFGRADFIKGHSHPYLYIDQDAVTEAGATVEEVEQFLAGELRRKEGIAYALTRSDLLEGRVAGAPMQEMIRRSFHPTRSGNIHLIPEQYWFLHSTAEAQALGIDLITAIHGSPWSYDTFVPLLFAGPSIKPQKVARRVTPRDLAPTLANYLGIKAPSGSSGNVLVEVIDN